MRFISRQLDSESRALQAIQDHRFLLRWVYAGRLSVATTIMLAAQLVWKDEANRSGFAMVTMVAFAVVVVATVASAFHSERSKVTPPDWFLFLQSVMDVLLVTLIVDVTGTAESPLAALYVVVVAVAFLLLPTTGGILVTIFAIAMFTTDVLYRLETLAELAPATLQVVVLSLVAIFSRTVSSNLRLAGAGSAALAAQLEHVKTQAADILSTIRSGIITVDARGRLLQANPAAAQLLDIEFDTLIDQPVLSRIHEVSPDLAEMLIRTIKRPTRINRGEAAMPRNGRNIPIGVTTTYAESKDGAPITATAIFQDISEMKRTELLSLRAERLSAVAELSASLAHEIKNPLASIRSAVEQLARVKYAGEDERTLAALVERESDRLSRLLSEFLDFARAQASNFSRIDIVSVARGACSLAASHPDCQYSVQIDVSSTLERIDVDGDEDLLHRAIFNLVLNAAQASPAGAQVRVHITTTLASQLPSLGQVNGEVVELTVIDEGPGIEPTMRDRLFDPFFTTKAGGSGLGLSVVHRAITSHGGVVLVDSGEDGTRFTILLPRERPPRGGHKA